MILSDTAIKERILSGDIAFDLLPTYTLDDQIGPASLDFRLGNKFKIYTRGSITAIDSKNPETINGCVETVTIPDGEAFILHPRQFILGVTAERIKVPYDLVARCEGRSSLGRMGIVIHSTAGFIDPGFNGTITLEITNINEVPVKIYPGMRFGQFAFETILGEVAVPYDKRPSSKYMMQSDPEQSRVFKDKEFLS